MPTYITTYLYKDFGVDYFEDFEIQWEAKVDSGNTSAICSMIAVSNTIGSRVVWTSANDSINTCMDISSNDLLFSLRGFNLDNVDHFADHGNSSNLLYFTMKRVGSTAYTYIHSDSSRETLVDTLSIACETGAKRYLYIISSWDVGISASISGYIQNVEVMYGSSSSSSSSSSST
jgi:hypothetical protein